MSQFWESLGMKREIWSIAPKNDFNCLGLVGVSNLAIASVLWGKGAMPSELMW